MEKNTDNKTIAELMNELMCNEKVVESALKIFKGQKVIINTVMHSSVNTAISIDKLDWIHLICFNEQHYIYISEHPFESITGNNLAFDIDDILEVEYSKDYLEIFFKDGLQLYITSFKYHKQ